MSARSVVRLPSRGPYLGGLLLGTAGVTSLAGFLGLVFSGAWNHYPHWFFVALGLVGVSFMVLGIVLIRHAWKVGRRNGPD